MHDSASLYRKFNFEKAISLTNELDDTIKDYQNKIKTDAVKGMISYHIYAILAEIYEIIETLYFLNNEYFKDKY